MMQMMDRDPGAAGEGPGARAPGLGEKAERRALLNPRFVQLGPDPAGRSETKPTMANILF